MEVSQRRGSTVLTYLFYPLKTHLSIFKYTQTTHCKFFYPHHFYITIVIAIIIIIIMIIIIIKIIICAVKEQALRTNYVKHQIDRTPESPLCRMCGEKVRMCVIY